MGVGKELVVFEIWATVPATTSTILVLPFLLLRDSQLVHFTDDISRVHIQSPRIVAAERLVIFDVRVEIDK